MLSSTKYGPSSMMTTLALLGMLAAASPASAGVVVTWGDTLPENQGMAAASVESKELPAETIVIRDDEVDELLSALVFDAMEAQYLRQAPERDVESTLVADAPAISQVVGDVGDGGGPNAGCSNSPAALWFLVAPLALVFRRRRRL